VDEPNHAIKSNNELLDVFVQRARVQCVRLLYQFFDFFLFVSQDAEPYNISLTWTKRAMRRSFLLDDHLADSLINFFQNHSEIHESVENEAEDVAALQIAVLRLR
jgi:hypothetical protein